MRFRKFMLFPFLLFFAAMPSCSNNQSAMYIKVMSYNIQHGIDHKKDVEQKIKEVNLNNVVDIIKKYDPDILNINEIYGYCDKLEIKEQVKYLGEKLGYNYYFVLSDVIPWMGNGAYGGAILTKHQIVSTATHAIPNPKEKPDLERRAIGQVGIKIPNNKVLNVCQSHFGGISETETIRDKERQNAIDTLKSLVENKENTLFMGDLNLVAGDQHHMIFVNQIKNMMTETIDESLPTFDSLNPTEHIDYMFCSHGMNFRNGQVLPDVYADHLPIMCEVEV